MHYAGTINLHLRKKDFHVAIDSQPKNVDYINTSHVVYNKQDGYAKTKNH